MTAGEAFQWVLPISGRRVALRHLTGHDEMSLLEAHGSGPSQAIAFASRLASDGIDAATLPVSDLDTLLLRLRQVLLGDRVLAETTCWADGCGARVDIAFGIADFLAHHRPGAPRLRLWRMAPSEEEGWFTLTPNGGQSPVLRLRLPTAGDERAVTGAADAAALLARRCIVPMPATPGARRAAEAAMAALAPLLAGPLSGICPECGAEVPIRFDPRQYVLAEFRARAAFVTEELDVLAGRYHWSEQAILDLPSPRRTAYAEMAARTS